MTDLAIQSPADAGSPAALNIKLPPSGYLRESQLIPLVIPFSSSTLRRMVRLGTFPKPVRLAPRVTAWRIEDVRSWMAARDAASAAEVAA